MPVGFLASIGCCGFGQTDGREIVQACCRALIVDTLPQSQQQHGSAWASRMIAVGNIAGYFAYDLGFSH